MALNDPSSSLVGAITMSDYNLGRDQTPTGLTLFIKDLEVLAGVSMTSSYDVGRDREWLEGWNAFKVGPESAIASGATNTSPQSPLQGILKETPLSRLPTTTFGSEECPRVDGFDIPADMTSDLEGSASANGSSTPPTSGDEFKSFPIGPQTIDEADRWCKAFLDSIMPPIRVRKRKATAEANAGVPTKKARVIKTSRSHLSGFPSMSEPLPAGLQHEDIIKRYPNHLRGDLLLDISENWTPKQMVEACGQPQLKSNTIVKRIHAAKIVRDGFRERRKPKNARPSSTASPTDLDDHSPTSQTESPESEASRRFRLAQTDMHHIIEEWDADFFATQADRDRKGKADKDRAMIERAALEREKRLSMRQ